jgi:hypothetical protein
MKRSVSAFLGGAVATAVIPLGYGVVDWRVLTGAAVIGGVGGVFGLNVPAMAKKYTAKRAAKTN